MMEFCKAFNAATQSMAAETPVPVVLTAYANRTFTFVTKTPPTSFLIRDKLGIEKGSTAPGTIEVGKITWKQIEEIAEIKRQDKHLKHLPIDGLCRSIAGSAASMGVTVIDDEDDDGEDAEELD